MTLQITTQIGKIETQQDRGVKLVMYTPELKAEELTELFRLKNDGEMITILEPIGRMAPKLENLGEVKPRSTSQKYRDKLYLLWSQEYSKAILFDDFYENEYRDLMNKVDDRLNPITKE